MPYPGGKSRSGIFQTIINLMPPHHTYIEPFLGGAAILRLKRPAALNIGVDLYRPAIQAVQAEFSGRRILSADLPLVDVGRPHRSIRRSLPAPHARNAGVAGKIGRSAGGRLSLDPAGEPGGTGENTANGRYRFFRRDAIAYLAELAKPGKLDGGELIYCDPPYLLSRRRSERALYKYEMTEAQHRELLAIVKELPCMVMISGYWSGLYSKALGGWNSVTFQTTTRRHRAIETLWFNFPTPVALHDYRFLGQDYRQRENIKRMKKRWMNKLIEMPVLQRQALLSVLASLDISGVTRGSAKVPVRPIGRTGRKGG